MEVKDWNNSILYLHLPMNFVINVGDIFKIVEGCNKSKSRCKELGNVKRYQGEPDMPGVDFLAGGTLQ